MASAKFGAQNGLVDCRGPELCLMVGISKSSQWMDCRSWQGKEIDTPNVSVPLIVIQLRKKSWCAQNSELKMRSLIVTDRNFALWSEFRIAHNVQIVEHDKRKKMTPLTCPVSECGFCRVCWRNVGDCSHFRIKIPSIKVRSEWFKAWIACLFL